MRDVGVIHVTDIDKKLPCLEALDLEDNKVFELEAIDELRLLSALVDINLHGNPLCIHKSLQDQIVEAMPQLEVVNRRDVQEAGARYKQDARRMKKELDEWEKLRPAGYKESDNLIADAIEDPAFELDMIMKRFKLEADSDDDEEAKIARVMKKNELITIKDTANKRITDKKIDEFEKVQHMRIKMLNEGAEEPEDKAGFLGYEYQADLARFQDKIAKGFADTRAKFRSVYNELRTKEHAVFANLERERAQDRPATGDAYARIEVEKAQILARLKAAGAQGKVAEFEDDSEEPSDGEEFYENDEDGKEDNEAEEMHQPRVGAKGGLPLPGGLPRPPNPAMPQGLKPVEMVDQMAATLDAASRSARGSEFRIKHNTSKGSLGATAGTAGYQNPAKKSTRPSLIGMNKPNQLKNQNDDIKRMLGMGDAGGDPGKADVGVMGRKVGAGARLAPVVRQSSVTRQSRGTLPGVDQDSLAGTPIVTHKKGPAAMRASSTSKFSASMSNMSQASRSAKEGFKVGAAIAGAQKKIQ